MNLLLPIYIWYIFRLLKRDSVTWSSRKLRSNTAAQWCSSSSSPCTIFEQGGGRVGGFGVRWGVGSGGQVCLRELSFFETYAPTEVSAGAEEPPTFLLPGRFPRYFHGQSSRLLASGKCHEHRVPRERDTAFFAATKMLLTVNSWPNDPPIRPSQQSAARRRCLSSSPGAENARAR